MNLFVNKKVLTISKYTNQYIIADIYIILFHYKKISKTYKYKPSKALLLLYIPESKIKKSFKVKFHKIHQLKNSLISGMYAEKHMFIF